MFFLAQIMNALAPNIHTVVVSRALQGVFGACGAALIGGSIADIWQPHERGLPMSLFAFSALFSFGLGSAFGGLIATSPHLGWRWVQWVHAMFTGTFVLGVIFVMSETRSSIILAQITKDTRKMTGDPRYRSSTEVDKPSMSSLIKTSCTRPLYFLLTEPIVQSFSLWIGFVWGIVFCLFESVTTEFQSVYNFSVGDTGFVLLCQRKVAILHTCSASDLLLQQRRSYHRFCAEHISGKVVPKTLSYKGSRSTTIHDMRCCCCPARLNVHLCMDRFTQYSLDCASDWADCFYDWHLRDIPSCILVHRRLLRPICLLGSSGTKLGPKPNGIGVPALYTANVRWYDI